MSKSDPVYEFLEEPDKLLQHQVRRSEFSTLCGRNIDQDEDQSTWFSDHDRAGDIILCLQCLDLSENGND